MNEDRVPYTWIGQDVVVNVVGSEENVVGMFGGLEDVHEGGVVLSWIDPSDMEPTLFYPWSAIRWLRLRASLEEPESLDDAGDPDEYEEQFRGPSARTLERVVPIVQKQISGGITLALSLLELYGEGLGVLRWQISFDESPSGRGADHGIPEPWFEIRDIQGHSLPWSPQGSGAGNGEADGEVRVDELPESGDLEVDVARLVTDAHDDGEYAGDGPSYAGPWNFRFTL
ncbi:hypothetical protein BH23ACT11_BH23ACT11_19110 [soil metagenome]